jgi:hypothetical protein
MLWWLWMCLLKKKKRKNSNSGNKRKKTLYIQAYIDSKEFSLFFLSFLPFQNKKKKKRLI